jgi:glycosyltransferase involved in cell wall biosynthesis
MIQVAALTGAKHDPAARFRIEQLIPGLRHAGINVEQLPAVFGSYPPKGVLPRLSWLPKTFAERTMAVLKSRKYDVTVFQRELISTLPTVEGLSRSPSILDVDDAIWLHRGGLAANNVARIVDHIVCGNTFLAEYFSRFGKQVSILPTAVDCKRYTPLGDKKPEGFRIGWSGMSGGLKYFDGIENILGKVLQEHSSWKLRIISDAPPNFRHIAPEKIEYFEWNPSEEVRHIQEIDIGLMPLIDSDWARGKCSYKMLLYMACGIPVVVSDFGMNRDVLALGEIGFGATKMEHWSNALLTLMGDNNLRNKLGENARKVAVNNFDLSLVIDQWSKILQGLV